MGVKGAAYATVIGQVGVSLIWLGISDYGSDFMSDRIFIFKENQKI